jgi:hypothetical protein
MLSSSHLPTRFPVGTKYVLEGNGLSVQRYVEFPNGRRVQLPARRALTCGPCTRAVWQQIGIVPDENSAGVYASSRCKRVVA